MSAAPGALCTPARRAAPAPGVLVVMVATIIACYVIARVRGEYLGGVAWPYLSDLGRGEYRWRPVRGDLDGYRVCVCLCL